MIFFERAKQRLGQNQGKLQIGAEHFLNFPGIQLLMQTVVGNAGIVHENHESSQLFDGPDFLQHPVGVQQIADDGMKGPAGLGASGCGCRGCFVVPAFCGIPAFGCGFGFRGEMSAEAVDLIAQVQEHLRDGGADAGGGTGDDGDIFIHIH